MHTLTGNTRYRIGFRGKIILQVEESFPKYYDPLGGGCSRTVDNHWRDATAEDIINGKVKLDD